MCDSATETCFTCPEDCGKCSGCGNGTCSGNETCASCQQDCGVCSVCGNKTCEPPYETCANCAADCGICKPLGCMDVLMCAVGCFQPMPSLTCIGNCSAQGCADVQFFVDQAMMCMMQNIQHCLHVIIGGGGVDVGELFQCMQQYCSAEFSACIAAECPPQPKQP
jgi:hypothetical protein